MKTRMDKYEFTEERKEVHPGLVVRRIKALVDIPFFSVKAGELGGFLEFSENLSQTGNCWVGNDAVVYGLHTTVTGDALVHDNALVGGTSTLRQDVRIGGNAKLRDCAVDGKDIYIRGDVQMTDATLEGWNIVITDKVKIVGLKTTPKASSINIGNSARIQNTMAPTVISGESVFITGNALLQDVEMISGYDIKIRNDATVKDGAVISGSRVVVQGAAVLEGNIEVGNDVQLSEYVYVFNELITRQPIQNETIKGDVQIPVTELSGAS